MNVFRPSDLGRRVVLHGSGMYVPPRVVTTKDLAVAGFAEGEVERLTGIVERRWVDEGVGTSQLAISACQRALVDADWHPDSVDRLIVATVSPDHPTPSAACLVQHGLGLRQVPSHDITASCTGFLYALDLAARCVLTGERRVLAVAADVRSASLDARSRNTFALFADGAGAVAVSGEGTGLELQAITLVADGVGAHSVYVPAGGSAEPSSAQTVRDGRHAIHMSDGASVYFNAVDGMVEVASRLLKAEGLHWDDVHVLVPHQPNLRILKRLAKVVGLPLHRVHINLDRYGNMSGASCAVALHEVLHGAPLPAGARLLLLAAGAGYTAGAAILHVPEGSS